MTEPPKKAESDWKSTIQYSLITDRGMRRSINQDSMAKMVAESQESWERFGHVFMVADGMGAHAAGELASQMATDLIPQNYRKATGGAPAESLHHSIASTNAEIFRRGQENIEFRSMGTTCSVLTLLPEGAVVAHVGDSRVYQLRGEQLYQLTFDHSLVWEMQAAGEVTDETARSGVIPKNVITRSLGPNASVEIDIEGPFPIRKGDRYLLCSDGLSGQIEDEEIGTILRVLSPEDAAKLFVHLSNLRGGPDNITALVIEVADDRLVTSNQNGITIRRNGGSKRFSPVLGTVAAVCLAFALILWLLRVAALPIVGAALGVIALITGIAQMFWSAGSSNNQASRYGNGPYRQYKTDSSQDLFDHMGGIMKSLREATNEQGWSIDWPEFDQRSKIACEAADSNNMHQALRLQSRIIIDLMERIRDQRDGDSEASVDL